MRRRTRLRKLGLAPFVETNPRDEGPAELLELLRLRCALGLLKYTDEQLWAVVQHPRVQDAVTIHGALVTALFITHVGRLPTEIRRSRVVFW